MEKHTSVAPVILSTEQLARILDVDPKTLRRWAKQGRGPARIKLGNLVRYDVTSVYAWLRAHERPGEQ